MKKKSALFLLASKAKRRSSIRSRYFWERGDEGMSTRLSPELEEIRRRVEVFAREYGLDYLPVIFEVLDWNQINMVAAYGDFPNRYPHWRFGMEYEQLSKSYAYGLSKIYEMVINNDPSY